MKFRKKNLLLMARQSSKSSFLTFDGIFCVQ